MEVEIKVSGEAYNEADPHGLLHRILDTVRAWDNLDTVEEPTCVAWDIDCAYTKKEVA